MLQWLVKNRSTGEESEDVIEAVSASSLETMIESVENLAVLFCKCIHQFSKLLILAQLGCHFCQILIRMNKTDRGKANKT